MLQGILFLFREGQSVFADRELMSARTSGDTQFCMLRKSLEIGSVVL